jgi:hypothetical protein
MPESIAETKSEASCCDGMLGEVWAAAEDCARREPLKCSAAAFFAGLLFAVLPVGTIVAALVRIGFALMRPLLLILGAMKVIEEVEKRQHR